jgi:ATP-dependent DNA helicase RecG
VVDDDGTVVGAQPRHGASTNTDRVGALIQNLTESALAVDVATFESTYRAPIPVRSAPEGGVYTKRAIDPRRCQGGRIGGCRRNL